MHQERDRVVSLATRCDEIMGLIDAVLAGPAVGEATSSLAATGLSRPGAPAVAVAVARVR